MHVHITILRLPLVHVVPSRFFPSLIFCRRFSPMLVLHFTFAYSISILLLIQLDTPTGMPQSMQSAKWKLYSSFRLDIWFDCFGFFFVIHLFFSLFFRFIMRLLMSNNNVHFYEYADGWTTEDLVFLWRAGDPVQVANNLQLPRFALEKFKTDSCNSKTNTG